MKRMINMTIISFLIIFLSLPFHAAAQTIRQEASLVTIDAIVEQINREARQINLKNSDGEILSFTLEENAGKLDDIEKGDQVSIEYIEAVTIEVFKADEIESGVVSGGISAETPAGEKPAAVAVGQVSVVVTIEAIDLENKLVTLKNKEGESKTVSPQYPENLKKVAVGDKVKITYTSAVGYSVTKKTIK
jgi:hypothetical protein